MTSPPPAIPIDVTAYRRRARQIRARFAGRPAAMHHELSGLARRSDRRPWVPAKLPGSNPVAGAVAGALERGFTDFVADRITRGPFTYSERMAALRSAERIGISRFRANLIVSLAVDQMATAPPDASHASQRAPGPSHNPPHHRTAVAVAIVAAELAIISVIYLLLA